MRAIAGDNVSLLNASLPQYLAPIASAAWNGEDDDKGNDDSIGATVPRIRAPNCKSSVTTTVAFNHKTDS